MCAIVKERERTIQSFRCNDESRKEHPQSSRFHSTCTRRKLEAKSIEVDEGRK